MEQGGKIESVSVLWQTDFSLTGSTNSVNISCPYKGTCSVEVDLPNGYVVNDDDEIELPSDTRLNASTQCMATAINGTLATSLSGGSDYLYYAALSKSHYQIGMRYKTYLAHSSTLACPILLVLSGRAWQRKAAQTSIRQAYGRRRGGRQSRCKIAKCTQSKVTTYATSSYTNRRQPYQDSIQ